MFRIKDKSEIGRYVNKLAKEKYGSVRQFCKAYLDADKKSTDDASIGKMENRMSQIKNGKNDLQFHDLQVMTRLLDVSCEEILSAGESLLPIANHMTNYQVAFTHDPAIWEQYVHHEEKPFLNPDEYNKTLIHYALEFKNYDLLKYLMKQGYIWFIDADPQNDVLSFGAGTSIKRRDISSIDALAHHLCDGSADCDQLRRQMISLAIENHDDNMLMNLRAREVPSLYQASYLSCHPASVEEYKDADMLQHISRANDDILGYFSEEFRIQGTHSSINTYIFPYMSELLAILIQNKRSCTDIILRKCIKHNQWALHQLQELILQSETYFAENVCKFDDNKDRVHQCVEDFINREFMYQKDGNMISFRNAYRNNGLTTNLVTAAEKNGDFSVDSLVDELNELYDQVLGIGEWYRQRKE